MRILGLQKQTAVVGVLKITATVRHRKKTSLLHNAVCQEHAYKYHPLFVYAYELDESIQSQIFSLT